MNKNKPLHVLVIATWYPNGKDKLLGVYHKQFCEALVGAGVKVNMLHIDRQTISTLFSYPFKKKRYQIEENGYTTYFRRMLSRGRISEHMQIKAYAKLLEKLYYEYEAKHGKPDILHAQVTVPAGYAAGLLGGKIGIPVIITEHASYFERFYTGWSSQYAKEAAKKAARVTCVGQYMKSIFKERFDIDATVLPNIVDCSLFARPKVKQSDKTVRFISICALRPGKKIQDAVAALCLLREEGKLTDFHYTVVGDGCMMEEYLADVKKRNMTDCVSFVGRKNREEIAELLSQSDIMLLPSKLETFSIPAVEAAAAGVPVVSTRCGGPEGFLTPDSSEFCDVGDHKSIAAAIERMVLRLPNIQEEKVRAVAQQFDSSVVAGLAISFYEDALKRK